MSDDSDKPMRVFLITNKQDSVLLRKASSDVRISDQDSSLKIFTERLLATVKDSMSLGVGIAAPQVGILKNVIWVQRFDKEAFPFEVYLNPTIRSYFNEKQDCMEGCLSIPDKSAMTKIRAQKIILEYDDLEGIHHKESVEGFTAVVFQHEIDHLNGILFTDHLEEETSGK